MKLIFKPNASNNRVVEMRPKDAYSPHVGEFFELPAQGIVGFVLHRVTKFRHNEEVVVHIAYEPIPEPLTT